MLPEVPEDPDDPLPPEAPSRLVVHEEYVPDPYFAETFKVNEPVLEL